VVSLSRAVLLRLLTLMALDQCSHNFFTNGVGDDTWRTRGSMEEEEFREAGSSSRSAEAAAPSFKKSGRRLGSRMVSQTTVQIA
jgi:hypothetical protein